MRNVHPANVAARNTASERVIGPRIIREEDERLTKLEEKLKELRSFMAPDEAATRFEDHATQAVRRQLGRHDPDNGSRLTQITQLMTEHVETRRRALKAYHREIGQ